ncbi:FAD-dependent oxidoreductase [Jannaschia sp. LMIT008]|uniref:FAD-dependent oxidoreductase n=1 Tax=Jannaschia maritima TaxID=3032585 RepID=UPI0028114064|nr:FAD-dependent oxidoreductase [Jannaschia sp. LMIT008]
MTATVAPDPGGFDARVHTLVVGGGATGMVAALAAREAGHDVVVCERDSVPRGSTALSAGLIPAAGTAQQREAGIDDDPPTFAADIQAKAHGRNDPALVDLMARTAAPVVDWLTEAHDLPLTLVDDFDYPGHSRRRMHGLPDRAGRSLIDALRDRAEGAGVDILCGAAVDTLFVRDRIVTGLGLARGERIGCDRVILACNGFGGNRARVARHMPDIADAVWFGHDGNDGAALDWAEALGAATRHLGAYQGHGNVAHPHGILITWATLTEGGIQLNRDGRRFHDESRGYSEAARAVLAQPGGVAVTLFDARIAAVARQFGDFRDAEAAGAVRIAADADGIEVAMDLPPGSVAAALSALPRGRLTPPFHAVRVTGALFHTQGGVSVDETARVLHADRSPFPNLYAAGGAACGVSGDGDDGYLSGNGLLSAVTLGHVAGRGS